MSLNFDYSAYILVGLCFLWNFPNSVIRLVLLCRDVDKNPFKVGIPKAPAKMGMMRLQG